MSYFSTFIGRALAVSSRASCYARRKKCADILDIVGNYRVTMGKKYRKKGLSNPRYSKLPKDKYSNTAELEIRRYVYGQNEPKGNSRPEWESRPEIPTGTEILDSGPIEVPTNIINTPWDSNEDYLRTHYELLREDAIRPLREAVSRIRTLPTSTEADMGNSIGIYDDVQIKAIVLASRGLAVRVSFSLERVGKRIRWQQSNRLMTGSLVALTPVDDMFQTVCITAIVAARPLPALEQNPPQIDLFFARPEDMEFDPGQQWVMMEERSAYFEADRHTLTGLQKIAKEPFPFSEHIVGLEPIILPPAYLQHQPMANMTRVFPDIPSHEFARLDILGDWPSNPWKQLTPDERDEVRHITPPLDDSQLEALQRILTKRFAIVQGPPGTGKTFISVAALKILLNNISKDDPPIIVACQTNHALDQLLRHVAEFEPDFIRLGGRTKDVDVIKKRTLFEVKQADDTGVQVSGSMLSDAFKGLEAIGKNIRQLLSPFEPGNGPLEEKFLQGLELLTEKQYASLRHNSNWAVNWDDGNNCGIEFWLGKALKPVRPQSFPDYFGVEFEEADLEYEQLLELEAENIGRKEDDDFEALGGTAVLVADNYIGKSSTSEKADPEKLLEDDDLYEIPSKLRGRVYSYLQHKAKMIIRDRLREYAQSYAQSVVKRKIGGWERDFVWLSQQKVIGMTTTGLSKYRALISSLKPRIILIEEAAETLEAPIAVGCLPSVEHLVLVGDHQQLRPHTHVRQHEGEPYFLNVSLFERLVKNEIEFSTLNRQRRMIPEIRRILKPIYGNLISDHPWVKRLENRPPVPGMGGVNSFFFTHEWVETTDSLMSTCNYYESDMIVGFFNYLCLNGVRPYEITILTFYNGQRKAILGALLAHPNLQNKFFKVVTVDSYQGEENDIVLLSLVRSNNKGKIGFLSVDNRVCVALSRAKRGFYIFGNGELLSNESRTWSEVVNIMMGRSKQEDPRMRIGYHLPLHCSNHGRKTFIECVPERSLADISALLAALKTVDAHVLRLSKRIGITLGTFAKMVNHNLSSGPLRPGMLSPFNTRKSTPNTSPFISSSPSKSTKESGPSHVLKLIDVDTESESPKLASVEELINPLKSTVINPEAKNIGNENPQAFQSKAKKGLNHKSPRANEMTVIQPKGNSQQSGMFSSLLSKQANGAPQSTDTQSWDDVAKEGKLIDFD
ncbi:P-loop containing nucleoside triphosphate hydrolase protein [Patellaria atrata CBS 101060]|uniref:P-loop containing nucleoside triphosphate hydrolase protein n=1 Tax=Patellaria atrata CBS 101060 TaxID=1346257 RepID=A0A9P4VRQ8_9PEZI|nr:P-loop containing nucleoside triphosphate hydrolase protein [Patellaria atrata CBS 101060]